jgi:hypothetical protein
MYMRAAIGLWFRRPFAEFLSYSVPPRIGGIFLTAAPFVGDGGWPSEDISLSDIGARLPEAAPIFLYHGNKDQTAPFGHVDLYAKGIPQARRCRYPARSSWASDAAALYVSGADAASYDPMWVRGTLFG